MRGRTDPAARQRPARRRRSRARPGHGGDRQRRVRCAGVAGSQPADHPRQPDRGDGIELMTSLNILSGGAAQGLVASLAPKFKEMTGFDIAGEFGAVGAMADKLRKGTPTDIVILTATIDRRSGGRESCRPRLDRRRRPGRNRACGPRRRSAGRGQRRRELARRVARGGCDLRSRYQGVDGRDSRGKGAAATRHRRRGRGPAQDLSEWRDRDAPSGRVRRGAADRLHAIDRDHQHAGRDAVGFAAAGMRARDHVYGGGDHAGRQRKAGSEPDRFADGRRSANAARARGLPRRGK